MTLPPFLKSLEAYEPDFAQAIEKVVSSAMIPGALDRMTLGLTRTQFRHNSYNSK